MTQKENAEVLKTEFEKELVYIRSREAHFRYGNCVTADSYDKEAKQVQRLIKVLEIFIIAKT